jgi:hemerythrin superfamily protein
MANSIEQIATKAAGTVKAVAAGFKGLRGVFLHLAEEHGEVGALMKRVSKTTDPQVRREHFPHIRAELLSHEKGELAEVYGLLANYEQLRSIVLEHNSQAHTLEKAIADVDAQDFASDQWGASFDRLVDLVQAHVDAEENHFFPKAQELIDEDESKEILERYEAAKQSIKQLVRT